MKTSEFRYSLLKESYVLVAEKRGKRSNAFIEEINNSINCPFDEGNESMTPPEVYAVRDNGRKKDGVGWKIRVIPNLYSPVEQLSSLNRKDRFFKTVDGYGYSEVVIETPIHNQRMDSYSIEQFDIYIHAIINRLKFLKKDKKIKQIQVFKNSGIHSGASQTHQHTQIVAIPFVPKVVAGKLRRLKRYYEKNGSSYFCDLAKYETNLNRRVVLKTAEFLAICPYDSKVPFEVMVLPTADIASLALIDNAKISSLSGILKSLISAFYKKFGDFSFNIILNEPPTQYCDIGSFFRFYITILPKTTMPGGFEQATGIFINPSPPEKAAKQLRDIMQ